MTVAPPAQRRVAFRRAFALLVAVRLLGTVALRYALPFIEDVADGLDVSITTLGFALAAGEIAGLGGPWLGRVLDRFGRRRGMERGLGVSVVGCLVVAAAPHVAVYGLGLFLIALGRLMYDVSLTAWIGDHVPYDRRGRTVGVSETAWSGALLLGVPIAGVLTALASWRVPYVTVAVLLVLAAPLVHRVLVADLDVGAEPAHVRPPAVDATPHRVRIRPVHVAIFTLVLGASVVFVTQGAWFERDLGLSTRQIAAVVLVLGAGEMAGSLASAVLSDRLGKRRSVALGLAVLVPAVLSILLVGDVVWAAIVVSFLVGAGLELALVSSFPIVLEVPAARRAGALGLVVLGVTGARAVASVAAPAIYEAFGITAVVAVAVPALAAAAWSVHRIDESTAM